MNKHKCKHCQNDINDISDKNSQNNKEGYFCSKSCLKAFNTLQEASLDSFYIKMGHSKLSCQSDENIDFDKYDSLAFDEEFISINDDGDFVAYFFIKGITCSACVWLNENMLLKQDGIISANINMSNKTAKIIYDKKICKTSKIIQTINSIGYQAHPYTPKIAHEQMRAEKKEYLIKLWVALFASLNIMMIDISKYAGIFTILDDKVLGVFHIAEFALASLTLFYSGLIFFKKAYLGAKHYIVNMEFLVSFGAILGYGYSIWVLFEKTGETYFDSVVMIITFVLIGKYLELVSKEKSVQALDEIQDIPMMINTINNKNIIIPKLSKMVEIGDNIIIKPNQKVAIDGIIKKGEGNFDIASINGESKPSYKTISSHILSGSISIDADIIYKATHKFSQSFLGKLSSILQESLMIKNDYSDNLTKLSSYFSLGIIILAIATFFGWYFLIDDFSRSFIVAISVVVIACPCALALAVPIAVMVSLDSLIKKNIICKNSNLLEKITQSKYCIFDKTNTLTKGNFKVIKHKLNKDFDINIIYSALINSSHIISKSVIYFLKDIYKTKIYKTKTIKEITSLGVQATIINKNKEYLIQAGSLKFLQQEGINMPNIKTLSSILAVAIDGVFVGYFLLEDELKEEALEVIQFIKNQGLTSIILSGDNENATKKVANILDLKYKANYSPEDKQKYIQDLKQKKENVIMIGDGINDVLALSTSDVSISFYDAQNITAQSSNILLGNKNLKSLQYLFKIAKNSKSLITQNITISLFYNAITIAFAIMGYITPLFAALSMSASSLIVVLNALRIKYKNDFIYKK